MVYGKDAQGWAFGRAPVICHRKSRQQSAEARNPEETRCRLVQEFCPCDAAQAVLSFCSSTFDNVCKTPTRNRIEMSVPEVSTGGWSLWQRLPNMDPNAGLH